MTPSDTAHPEGEIKREHDLKTWPTPFADVKAGRKPFEFRFNDRDFREGDTLRLREWSPDTEAYTGETLERGVGYILQGGQFGIPDGYVIMALTPPSRPQGEEGLWRPISEAPRDGTVVDLWAAGPDGRHGRRITDCRWDCNRSFNGGIGRVALPDAWTNRGGGEAYFDGLKPTHFRLLPEPPALSNQGKP